MKAKQEFCCYHVTTKDRLPNILRRGLIPNAKPSWVSSRTPYIMLSLYPYLSLYQHREAWGLSKVNPDNVVLIEVKSPDIKREYFDDPEGLRWPYSIPIKCFNAIIEFNVLAHGRKEVTKIRRQNG